MLCVITVSESTTLLSAVHTRAVTIAAVSITQAYTRRKTVKDATPEASTLKPEAAVFHFSVSRSQSDVLLKTAINSVCSGQTLAYYLTKAHKHCLKRRNLIAILT